MGLPRITIKKMAEETGYTEAALRAKIDRGEFAEGIHYIHSPDGRIHFNVEEYLKWVESKHMGTESKSRSSGTARGTGQRSESRQPQPT